jgi:type IV pilus assembly protein PilE
MCREARPAARAGPPSRRARGFTLIEMMIVVVVIALLGAVALPSYQRSVAKARRADAKAALSTAAQMMERYSTENPVAGYSTATLSSTAGPTVVYKNRSDNGNYALSLSGLAVMTFTLNATPLSSQAADPCGTFTLNERGDRGVTGGTRSATECW